MLDVEVAGEVGVRRVSPTAMHTNRVSGRSMRHDWMVRSSAALLAPYEREAVVTPAHA